MVKKKNIVFFTGAGMSRKNGLPEGYRHQYTHLKEGASEGLNE